MSRWSPNYDAYEVFGSRTEDWMLENPMARVTIECDMDERYLVHADIVGEHRLYPFDTPTPLYAVSGTIRLDSARKDSVPTPPDNRERYTSGYKAYIDLMYTGWQNLFWNNPGNIQPFPDKLEHGELFEPTMQFVTDDFTKFGWSSAPSSGPMDMTDPRAFDGESILKQGEEVGIPFYQINIDRTVMGYKGLPVGYTEDFQGEVTGAVEFQKWPGYVHSKSFRSDFTGITYEAGTLLFTQPSVRPGTYRIAYNTSGSLPIGIGYTYKITAKLIYQPQGWNAFYRTHCANDEDQKGWYNMVYLGCDPQAGFRTGYNPYSFLDMSQFIFSSHDPPRVVKLP